MKNVKKSKINNLSTTYDFDEQIEYGRRLHSKAVFTGLVRIFHLFRNDTPKTVQVEQQEKLNYSH